MIVQGRYHPGSLVFPGSFNPMHAGHVAMAQVAAEKFSGVVQPEISIVNVDKPDVDDVSLAPRLAQVQRLGPALITKAPLFADKASLFPGCRFVIGADTALRLSDACYAGGDPKRRDQMLASIADRGCRFVVFGRVVGGVFCDAAGLQLARQLSVICDFVPETEFRVDISSTELR